LYHDQEELGTGGAKKPAEILGEEETSYSFSERVFGNPKEAAKAQLKSVELLKFP